MVTSLAAALVSLALLQQPEPVVQLKVGDPAPALQFDHLLGGAFDGKTPLAEALRGKVVVLEFSTGWCAGCRASVPHWNELAKALAKQPVVFLSITNESKDAATRFIAETGLQTALGVDLDGSLFEAFGVGGIPDVVVIGRDGRIAGFSHPQHLEAAALEQLAAGKPTTFAGGKPRARRNWNQTAVLGDGDPEPGSCSVRAVDKANGMIQQNKNTGVIRGAGLTLTTLYATLLDCDPADIEIGAQLPVKSFFDLRVCGAERTLASARALALERLGAELQIDVATTTPKTKVLVLQRAAGHQGPPAPDAARKGGWLRPGDVHCASTTAADLVKALRFMLPAPMVDETGLTTPFSIDLTWDQERGVDALREALAEYGLRCVDGERPVSHHRLAVRVR
jgi:peroxiredoxin